MLAPDDSALLHARPYDPVKAREYYLRTRHLKGRRPSSVGTAFPTRQPRSATVVKRVKKASRRDAEAQVAALEARLDRLHDVLARLVKEAKARSGVETKSDSARKQADRNSDSKGKSPQTAKQKRDAAERSREHYEKNKKTESPSSEIQALQRQIKDIRAKIQAALDDARKKPDKSKSQTASKGR